MQLPFRIAVAHSCTCTSGILEASCMAGVTIFIDSLLFPNERNMCPNKTRLQEVNLFKSSELAIINVSLRYLLKKLLSNIDCIFLNILITFFYNLHTWLHYV